MSRPAEVVASGRTFAYVVVGGLWTSILWGAPDEVDARALVTAWQRELDLPVHDSLFDAGQVTAIDPTAFALIRDFLTTHAAGFARTLRKQAVVAPGDMAGATIAGYYAVYRPAHPTSVFASRAAALAWLEHAAAAPALAAIDDLHTADDPAAALATWLAHADLARATIATAAAALCQAPRSLQRRLAERGTTFARERARAQVAAAQRLLVTTDAKLSAIGAEIGCASMSTFNELFRREVGMTPKEWRAAQRARTEPARVARDRTSLAPRRK